MDLKEGEHYYIDKRTGLLVFTEKYHLERGYCCNSGCRHCPYRVKKEDKESYNSNSADNSGNQSK